MTDHIFFNAHHSPIGAFASFTLGFPGAKGGLGLELGQAANQNVFIGAESAKGVLELLPFFAGAEDERARYAVANPSQNAGRMPVAVIPRARIRRDFRLCTDTWTAGDLSFRVISPVLRAPDPERSAAAEQRFAYCPAVLAELTVDNRKGRKPRRAVFGYQGSDPYSAMRRLDDTTGGEVAGVACGLRTAIACRGGAMTSSQGFDIVEAVEPRVPENHVFGLGPVGVLVGTVPAGRKRTFRLAICFHRGGVATSGIPCTYWYTRFFPDIESVAAFALANFRAYAGLAEMSDRQLDDSGLSADQRFQLSHAIRSYYGSTEFLDWEGRPFWVVNEGEYRMMNTFDLTVDQLFYEMRLNPWTVRNELDMFLDRFSYRDTLHFPGGKNIHPGGLSFTHDMGVANAVSRPGHSSYELFGLDGCFSHMTHEQLVNYVLCAAVYLHGGKDRAWGRKRLPVLRDCLESLVRRDHPEPAKRTGVMKLDSSRTGSGAEITTYDSLDQSLGQARGNLYMAVKTWAAYLALEKILGAAKLAGPAAQAREQAGRCAATIVAAAGPDGLLPAVLGEGNEARIIPAVEGLVFPLHFGRPEVLAEDGPYGALVQALKRHLAAVLKPGVCLFKDGGWKLSSTSDNSWLSKIYLCQHVARRVLGFRRDARDRRADAAHKAWLLHPELSWWSWSDQIVAGRISASKYYPRGVTCVLWLDE